jgi:glutaconate CoA-transferase subunit B
VITTKCVLRFGDDAEAYLSTYHPGVSVDDVLANTGWKLKVAPDAEPTPEPNATELKAIREYDAKGFWTS